ncbi:ABC transporter ATP-binding protein [Lactiplantibacillus plantarum]|uniref:ABC transporter ATP-binding protein n=1 Tax=Lactiplantibacillus plantarum TaxID=1590 RepID=UPI001BA5F9BE|nr:ABC transporter ATP-binding protein [Lactiplantibacillus plantarum]MBS0956103.1 ABC transporter ATP-binding protein [Lactiplantibacillus plantarum]
MASIALNNLTYTYPQASTPILDRVNLTLPRQSFILLTGPSGTGKSTLLKLIAGLLPLTPDYGTITFDGQSLTASTANQRAQHVAMMFQNPNQQFAMDTVENELIFALENLQVPRDQIPARLLSALDFVGIRNLQSRLLNHLSGGEKQKVALAIIVAMDSDVILLDEPFASVDPTARAVLLDRLVELRNQHGKTIILADHDLTGYEQLVDQVVQIKDQHLQLIDRTTWSELFSAFTEQPQRSWSAPQRVERPCFQLDHVTLQAGDRQLLVPTTRQLLAQHNTLITGPNGSGKSTLFEALVRLHPYTGEIRYEGTPIDKLKRKRYARHVALLFQDAETQFLNITVAEELARSKRYAYGDYFTADRIQTALVQLNLSGRDEQVIYTLSEGQKKKLQILLMLIMQSPVLLMDEPLKGLDLHSINALVALLQTTQAATKQTLIIISHQLTGLMPLIDYQLHFENHHLDWVVRS